MKQEHTPTPWTAFWMETNAKTHWGNWGFRSEADPLLPKYVRLGRVKEASRANAALIVRAVNAHEALFNACVMACASMDELASNAGDVEEWNEGGHAYTALDMLRAAIAKAKGE